MNYYTKFTALSLVITYLLGSPLSFADPSTEVSLFKYRGVKEGHDSDIKFDVFKGILDRKIINIQREVVQQFPAKSLQDGELGYLKKVHVTYRDSDAFATHTDVQKWIANQSNTLGVLRGSLISDDNQLYSVFTEFHPRNLDKYYPYDVITIELPIQSTEFGNSRDSHSVVILFALALDARRAGLKSTHVISFLSVASNKIADIKRRRGALPGDLSFVEEAITKITNELLGAASNNE